MTGLRALLKQSRLLHAAYKLIRILPDAPFRSWLRLRRTALIFHVLPNTMVSARGLMQAYDWAEAVEREHIDGDVAECGVWAGGTIGLMAAVNKRWGNRERRFHLFDSFEGLPQPSAYDADVLEEFRKHHPELGLDDGGDPATLTAIGACAAPLDAVDELFDVVLGIDRRQVAIHKGWFQDTVPRAAETIDQLAVLRIDGDWYESTKVCLEGLYDKVVAGGYVGIDDYDEFSGCRRALDEFLASRDVPFRLTVVPGAGVYFRKPPVGAAAEVALTKPQREIGLAEAPARSS
jgi:O-methyltransferase